VLPVLHLPQTRVTHGSWAPQFFAVGDEMPSVQERLFSKEGQQKYSWYWEYCAAMLESNRESALTRIEKAQKAIQDRAVELKHAISADSREAGDLKNASNHLGILLGQFSTDGGNILWD